MRFSVIFLMGWIVGLGFISGHDLAAGERPFSKLSPDSAWVFEANWFGGSTAGSGYLSDIKEVATGRTAFADKKPHKDEILPVRISIEWSPDSRSVRIHSRYGRAVSDDVTLVLDHGKWVETDLPKPVLQEN
jgi:hypothetical protein